MRTRSNSKAGRQPCYDGRVRLRPFDWIRRFSENPTFRFIGLFSLYLGILAALLPIGFQKFPGIIDFAIRSTAKLEYWILWLFSDQVSSTGTAVYFGHFAVQIITECTGLFEMVIYAACVLAFPTSWRKKGLGLLLGIPAIYVFNLLRIVCLLVVGRYANSMFDFFHLYFWQATLIIMITSVWLLWIYVIVRDETDPSLPG
jgi:archaeosortase B (VPXXXP-CTERM-specific)